MLPLVGFSTVTFPLPSVDLLLFFKELIDCFLLERVGVIESALDCDTSISTVGTLGDFLAFFNFDLDSVQPIICASKTTCDYQKTRSKFYIASTIMNSTK